MQPSAQAAFFSSISSILKRTLRLLKHHIIARSSEHLTDSQANYNYSEKSPRKEYLKQWNISKTLPRGSTLLAENKKHSIPLQ